MVEYMSFCARATMRAIAEEIKQKQFRGSMGLGESNGKSTDTVWSTNMGEEAKELDQAFFCPALLLPTLAPPSPHLLHALDLPFFSDPSGKHTPPRAHQTPTDGLWGPVGRRLTPPQPLLDTYAPSLPGRCATPCPRVSGQLSRPGPAVPGTSTHYTSLTDPPPTLPLVETRRSPTHKLAPLVDFASNNTEERTPLNHP